MSRQVIWTSIIVDEFCRLANLPKLHEAILRTRANGMTIKEQSMTFHISERSCNRIIKDLKARYDAVQPYSPLLPPRKNSAKELYMDTH